MTVELQMFWQKQIDRAKEQNPDKPNLEILKEFAEDWRQIKKYGHNKKIFIFETNSNIYKVNIKTLQIINY